MKFSMVCPPFEALYTTISHKAAQTRNSLCFCAFLWPIYRISGSISLMKTVTRIVIVAAIAAAIYFATIGRSQFYDLLDFFNEIIQAIASGYLKK